MFHIVQKDGRNEVDYDHPPFDRGSEAQEKVRELNRQAKADGTNLKFRVLQRKTQLEATAWHAVEQAKFESGTYKKVPWYAERWVIYEHFPHVSMNDPSKLAYIPSAEYGSMGRRVSTTPGRYLQKYYRGVLKLSVRKEWVARFSIENTTQDILKIARTEKEICWVYNNGPGSCMSGHSYNDRVRAYASPDLGVAYILNATGTRASARTIVNFVRMVHSRIYGSDERFRVALKKAGFSDDYQGGTHRPLVGARLKRFDHAGCYGSYYMPSIDGGFSNYRPEDDEDGGKWIRFT